MHALVKRIKEPKLCYVFAKNAEKKGHPGLALEAFRHAVDLHAAAHQPTSEAELAALRSIYAYEEALTHNKGKRTRATGTWQLVNKHGVFNALRMRLKSSIAPEVSVALKRLKMDDYSFSAVLAAYPGAFEQEAA